jgi:transposase, IS5 family
VGRLLPLGRGAARDESAPGRWAGLLYLQHAHGLSDEAVVARWVENPHFQHFTGETFVRHRAPIHPSSLSRRRGRIGEEGVGWMLTKTIEAGRAAGAVTPRSLSEIAVDTTVMGMSCTRFPWTAICPTGDRHGEVQHG